MAASPTPEEIAAAFGVPVKWLTGETDLPPSRAKVEMTRFIREHNAFIARSCAEFQQFADELLKTINPSTPKT